MTAVLRSEWRKLSTSPGTPWLLLAVIASTTGVGALAAATVSGGDRVKTALTGVQLGQAVVVILAVLLISGEYATGMIRVSLAATPRRTALLAAKAALLTSTVAVTGALAIGTSLLVAHAPVTAAALRSVLYLCLMALLALGASTVVRETGASIGLMLGLLYLPPLLLPAITDPAWKRHIQHLAPASGGLGTLAWWALAAMLLGAVTLSIRDA
ncbi:hypothetical protein [Hamadaea tsunoensis]|uniref:hypothetical protein n=1 Tax=Hamadaea tsunoensis TaxID=53368 RepID=UPI00041A3EAD|nr:hypothetical protein [Hamadaea tsunoensis]